MAKQIPKAQINHDNSTRSSQQHLSKKTFGNQNILPRLPVPDLFDTCNKLIEWVEPLLSENELRQTKKVVDEFQRPGGDGEKLQEGLIRWSQRSDLSNWLEPFWNDMYLKSRVPVPINRNFSIGCEENPVGLTQIQRAAALIISTLKFKVLIDTEELEVDQEKGHPVCMMQFKRLFSATRIPKRERGRLRLPSSISHPNSSSEKHIVVLYNGHIFVMDVLTESGKLRTSEEIEKDLVTIIAMGEEKAPVDATIGILTTMNRDDWADARDMLLKIHPHNKDSLDTVETALFALCLDDSSPDTLEELFIRIFHGEGRDRWFDKSFQFIVCKNGRFGVSGEHSGIDGYPVHRMIRFIDEDNGKVEGHGGGIVRNEPRKLGFHLNDELKQVIMHASRSFNSFINNTEKGVFEFTDFGKDSIKILEVHPDAFAQLALQLSLYKLFGKFLSTYEVVATRRFLHGRTETLRSVSLESAKFIKNMVSASCDDNTKARSLREAAQKHVARMMECMAGMGVERHMFGLQSIYERIGRNLGIHSEPKIFNDRSWLRLRHDTLSTTSVPDPHGVLLSGFGPVVNDGFGIVYFIKKDSIILIITSRAHMKEELNQFASNFTQSLSEMGKIMERTSA